MPSRGRPFRVVPVMRRVAVFVIAALLTECSGPASQAPGRSAAMSPSPSPSALAPASATASPSGASSPTPSPIPLPTSVQLSAPSGAVVWALVAGSRLFRSTDRGGTWSERALPPQVPNTEVSFADDRVGWLASLGSPATQCAFQSVRLWRTTDAAATWTLLPASGIGNAQCKEELSFADLSHGFLSAWDPDHPPVVYRTTDGGATWRASAPLPDPPAFATRPGGFTLRAGTIRAFGPALLVEASGQSGGHARRFAFGSTDGGASWTYIATAPDALDELVFVTAARWLQIVPGGASRETTDGGRTWHAYTSDYSQAAPIAPRVVFGDGQVGYASVRGGIQRTLDGGAHWARIATPGTR